MKTFRAHEALQVGKGQCGDYHIQLYTILVQEGDHRRWYGCELHVGREQYVVHDCRPSGDAPARKVA